MGVQASAAVPAHSRVPLAGRTLGLCRIPRGGERGAFSPFFSPQSISVELISLLNLKLPIQFDEFFLSTDEIETSFAVQVQVLFHFVDWVSLSLTYFSLKSYCQSSWTSFFSTNETETSFATQFQVTKSSPVYFDVDSSLFFVILLRLSGFIGSRQV